MPSRWRVGVKGVDARRVTPRGLHAIVSTWLDGPDVEAHQRSRKPWSLSPPFDTDDGAWAFDVGVLDDALAADLAAGAAVGTPLRFGEAWGESLGCELLGGSSWSDLVERARARRRWTLRFVSPMAFRHRQRYQPLPVPRSVFGHYLACVRSHGPDGVLADLDLAAAHLEVAHLEGRTASVFTRFGHGVGFVGTVTFECGVRSMEVRRSLDFLASVAPYSGTGTHTTAGMGVTERVR